MDFRDIIKQSVLDNFMSDMSPQRVILVLGAALLFGIYIFMVYRFAVRNEFYSKDFNKTLTMMSVVTAGIVLAIQSNLVISLGMVGALSIVRFRTAVKSPMDLFFLYWAISVGIICGAGLYMIAGICCIAVTILLFALDHMASPAPLSLLVIHCDSAENARNAAEVVKKMCKFSRLKNKTVRFQDTELVMEVKIKWETELEEQLSNMKGVTDFSLMNFDRETRI